MAVTPYLRLQKPPFDSIPWDQAINGNMDILDSTIAQFLSVPGYTGTWVNATNYTSGQVVLDAITATMWQCLVSHTSAVVPTTFAQDRAAHPTYWLNTTTAPVAPVDQHNVGRNLLHNPLFNVAQRGAGPWVAGGYTLDRWWALPSSDTISISQLTLVDSDRTAIGDEQATFALQNVFTGNAAAGAYNQLIQKVEGVRRLAGKTITISFWARAASGTPKLGSNLTQLFGTGGSPSAPVRVLTIGNAITLSTTWARYTSTINVASVAGKTIGTNGDDCLQVEFWYSSGATSNAAAGNIGIQSGTIQLWGVQLEIGSVATPLEKPDPRYDLANCLRFAVINVPIGLDGWSGGVGFGLSTMITYPTPMRAAPTITINASTNTGLSAIGPFSNSVVSFRLVGTTSLTGSGAAWTGTYTASADL